MKNIVALEKFIKNLNSSVPSVESFLNEHVDIETAKELRSDLIINYKSDKLQEYDSFLETFIRNTRCYNFQSFGFRLNSFIDKNERFNFFGYSNSGHLAEDNYTNEIFVVDVDQEVEDLIPIAPNFLKFTEVLILLAKYESLGYTGSEYTDKVKDQLKTDIRGIFQGDKYLSYYFDSIPA